MLHSALQFIGLPLCLHKYQRLVVALSHYALQQLLQPAVHTSLFASAEIATEFCQLTSRSLASHRIVPDHLRTWSMNRSPQYGLWSGGVGGLHVSSLTASTSTYRLCMDHGHINKHYRHTASGYVVTIRMQYNLPHNLSIKKHTSPRTEGWKHAGCNSYR